MVKSAKLWREISRQYAKLAEVEAGASEPASRPDQGRSDKDLGGAQALHDAAEACGRRAAGAPPGAEGCEAAEEPDEAAFYSGGLQHKHWVLFLCAMMIMCEWMDRSVLSIAMQPIKEEFQLSDTEVGLMASSSLWVVPLAITFAGRLADYVPKARMLAIGVFGWGACTFGTGAAPSFAAVIVSRLCAGLSNCAGYPVAVSLLAEFFGPTEMTTAMGYFNAGCAVGGLLGMALGGLLITQLGWRWAFWGVGAPQLLIALLLAATVRSKRQPAPKQPWASDIRQLLRLPALRYLMLASLLSGLMSGNHRFISALAQRLHGVDAQTVGSVMGLALGSTGVVAAWCGGHAVDRASRRSGCRSTLLRCAAGGDGLHLAFGTAALLMPSFGLLVLLLALAACAASLGQGVDTAVQLLAQGRRGTTQSFLELCWALGMGVGPFLAGVLSDSLQGLSCDEGCALAQSLLVVGGLGMALRAFSYLMAAVYLPEDLARVEAEQGCAAEEGGAPAAGACEAAAAGCPSPQAGVNGAVGAGEAQANGCCGGAQPESASPCATTLGRSAAA